MDDFGGALRTVLNHELFSPQAYTVGRAVLLLVLCLVIWFGRRLVWVWLGFGIWAMVLTVRVVSDVLNNGADGAWTVYFFFANLGSFLGCIGICQLVLELMRLRSVRTEAAVLRAERDAARATVDSLKRQYNLAPTNWPTEPGGTP